MVPSSSHRAGSFVISSPASWARSSSDVTVPSELRALASGKTWSDAPISPTTAKESVENAVRDVVADAWSTERRLKKKCEMQMGMSLRAPA